MPAAFLGGGPLVVDAASSSSSTSSSFFLRWMKASAAANAASRASAAGAEMAALGGGVHGSSAGRVNLLQNRRDMVEEIVGEAGIMSYLRHPRILQLFGCSLTAQAIWIVSELCSQGSLRQVLDDKVRGGEGLE